MSNDEMQWPTTFGLTGRREITQRCTKYYLRSYSQCSGTEWLVEAEDSPWRRCGWRRQSSWSQSMVESCYYQRVWWSRVTTKVLRSHYQSTPCTFHETEWSAADINRLRVLGGGGVDLRVIMSDIIDNHHYLIIWMLCYICRGKSDQVRLVLPASSRPDHSPDCEKYAQFVLVKWN